MSAPMRRGACPALSAPMQTGDGLLVRLNPSEAGLSPATMIGLCEAAARHGNGLVEVTARGSFQIRGATEQSISGLRGEVDLLGIAVRSGVPVETGPLAGLDRGEIADPRPLAATIRARIAEGELSARLGPKVSVVVDGGGVPWMNRVAADIRLNAVRDATGTRWRLAVAGDARSATVLGDSAEPDAGEAASAILTAVADLGVDGRARDLTPDRLSASLATDVSVVPRRDDGKLKRLDGPLNHVESLVGSHWLADGRHAVAVALPFGQIEASRLADFVACAAAGGAAEIRLAPQRVLLLICPDEIAASAVKRTAREHGLVVDPRDPLLFIAACPGSPACRSGRIATRSIAEAFATEHGDVVDGSFTLHVSGCAKGCAHPAPAELTLAGTALAEPGAVLVANGTASAVPLAHMPADGASPGLAAIAEAIRFGRRPGETTAAVLSRLGPAGLAAAFLQEAR